MLISLLSSCKSKSVHFKAYQTFETNSFYNPYQSNHLRSLSKKRRRVCTHIQCVSANDVAVKGSSKIGHLGKNISQDEHLLDIDQEELLKEVNLLLDLLPEDVSEGVRQKGDVRQLLEVVLDLGRPPLARYNQGDQQVRDGPVTSNDLKFAIEGVTDFGGDNRAGINSTLHRISAIRNRQGQIIGLTCRVGRAVRGSAKMIQDFIKEKKSVLLLGPPGVGKTTVIRDVARMLADPPMERRVVIVDTSNEIGGDGDIPHAGIGRSRRMQVPHPLEQHKIMIEAVENHMPQVIIIDEIGTIDETAAARTIAQRGVQLIGTAHGNKLENLIKNPSLLDLVGGIQSVTLGDDTARKRGVQKSVLERKGPPSFDVCVEIVERGLWVVHPSVGESVDALLQGKRSKTQIRKRTDNSKGYELVQMKKGGQIMVTEKQQENVEIENEYEEDDEDEYEEEDEEEYYEDYDEEDDDIESATRPLKILPYKIKRSSLEQAFNGLDFKMEITDKKNEADAAIGVRDDLRTATHFRREMRLYGVPVYGMKTQKMSNLIKALNVVWKQHRLQEEVNDEEQNEDDQEEEEEEEEQEDDQQTEKISDKHPPKKSEIQDTIEQSDQLNNSSQSNISVKKSEVSNNDNQNLIQDELSEQEIISQETEKELSSISSEIEIQTQNNSQNNDINQQNNDQKSLNNVQKQEILESGKQLILELEKTWGKQTEINEQSLLTFQSIFGELNKEQNIALLEVELVVQGKLSSENVVSLTPQKKEIVDQQVHLVRRYNVFFQRNSVGEEQDRIMLSKKSFQGSEQ